MSLLLHETRTNPSLQFAVWTIEESEEALELLCGIKAPSHLKTPTRRLEYLAVRTLAVKLGINPASIVYKPTGQPYLQGDSRTISITHTKGHAALLLSDQPGTGIDMEARSERVLRVKHKYMHPEEEALLLTVNMDETTGLLLHWCVKEAVFKAIPEEGIDFKQDIRVNIGSKTVTYVPTGKLFTLETWCTAAYALVVCYPSDQIR